VVRLNSESNPPEQHSLLPEPKPIYDDDEIDLRKLLVAIWAGRWIILAVTTVFAVSSVIYAINQPNIYKAQALLSPVSSSDGGGLSAMARKFGGLASLAGVNLGGNSGDKTTLAIEVMTSRQFITDFIQKYDILVPLMATKGWNQTTNELMVDPKLYDTQSKQWVRRVELPATPGPSLWDAHKKFKGMLSVSQAKDSGFITVAIENISPQVAQQWVEWLVKEINSNMKTKDLEEARNSIAYLSAQLENTQVSEMQNVFYQLIEEQTKTVMLSEVRDEYVFATVDPAVVPEEKFKPSRALVSIGGAVFGGFLGCIIALMMVFFRRKVKI
jgi:uncharacterized protein involved in exopolysaccharide biosynthesis